MRKVCYKHLVAELPFHMLVEDRLAEVELADIVAVALVVDTVADLVVGTVCAHLGLISVQRAP